MRDEQRAMKKVGMRSKSVDKAGRGGEEPEDVESLIGWRKRENEEKNRKGGSCYEGKGHEGKGLGWII